MPVPAPRASPAYLLALMAGSLLICLVLISGGFAIRLPGFVISVRNPLRPAAALAVLLGWYVWKRRRIYAADAAAVARFFEARSTVLAVILALAVSITAIAFGTWAAGGADSYGYVSQAELWLAGDLVREEPMLKEPLWRNEGRPLAPLGYTVHRERPAIVPTYAPGLPLMMAGFRAMFGECGVYLVVPLLAGVAVMATYKLGALTGSNTLGLAAALWLVCSPAFLYMSMWPMTDVPVTAMWTLSLVLLLRPSPARHVAAGLAAGLAVLIRPNLGGLVPIMAVVLLVTEARRTDLRLAWRPAALFTLGAVPGAAIAALVQHVLYGAPWRSGYPDLEALFSVANVVPNTIRYSTHLIETQSPLLLLSLLGAAGAGAGWSAFRSGAARVLLVVFAGGVWASYLLYGQFQEWWYLRFFLCTFPVLFVLALLPVWGLARRFSPRVVLPLAWIAILAMIAFELASARDRHAFDLHTGERRYAAVGEYIARHLPPNAAFIAMQHSGAVRHYAKRLTVRYDWLEAGELQRALRILRQRGYKPYVVLDDWEQEEFVRHFRGEGTATDLAGGAVARYPYAGGVTIFDPDAPNFDAKAWIPDVRVDRCGLPGSGR